MNTCQQISDQMLDFLYGLLDEDEQAQIRTHLETCPVCQPAFQEAQKQQRLFAQAARACTEVKPFAAPDFDAPPAELAPAVTPTTTIEPALPIQPQTKTPPARPRMPRWMTLSAVVLAASVLLAVIFGENYRSNLQKRESQLADAQTAVQTIEAEFSRAQKTFDDQAKNLPADRAKEVLHLQVSTVAHYRPQAPATCTVQTTGVGGQPRSAKVEIQVLDKAGKQLAKREVDCDGLQTVQLPPGLASAENQVSFRVSARAESATAKVEAKLRQTEPSYVTHLVTNKTAYRIGDLLFFRTVTLDRFSLKPAAKAMPLRFSLVSLDGAVVKQLPVSQTAQGGIGGGEFALTGDIPSGICFLQVASAQENGPVLQRRRLEIIRDDTPQIIVDGQKKYYEGDKVALNLRDRANNAPLANTPITVESYGPANTAGPAQAMQKIVTDAKGNADVNLPLNLNSTRAILGVRGGQNNNLAVQSVPVIPSKIAVDFYPEGGDLVDGLPTRLYYRVTSLDGEPVVPKGKIVFRSSKGVLYESKSGQASDVFAFTPYANESYAVRITDPQFEVVQGDPIEKLGVQARGLNLSIPTGVTTVGEPIRVLLANKGEAKRVVVMVSCRGQIVLHETTEVGAGQTELKLTPPADIAGVLRVTAYQAGPQGLTPLAERLVFRMPGQKLELSATGTFNVARGQKAQLEIKGVNEKQQPAGYFALAYVVDAKAKTDKDSDMPTHFYLAGDVPEGDLELAQIVLRDDLASRQALDLFLGAQPWRRVPIEPEPALVAQAPQDEAKAAAKNGQERAAAAPVLLSLENAGLGQLQAQYETRLAKALSIARADFLDRKNELTQQRDAQSAKYRRIAADLAEYRQLPEVLLRQALSVVVMLGLLLGGALLLFGLLAVARQRSATFALGGSFACFALCMAMYLTARQFGAEGRDAVETAKLDLRPWRHVPDVNLEPAQPPLAKADAHMLPAGQYALAAGELREKQVLHDQIAKAEKEQVGKLKELDALASAKVPEAGISNQLGGGGAFGQAQERRFAEAKTLQEKHLAATPAAMHPVPGVAGAPPPAAPPGGLAKKSKEAKDGLADKHKSDLDAQGALVMQNSPYIWPKQGHPDTIVWFPTLVTETGVILLSFPVPNRAATYRVIVHGHSGDGRLGYFEGNLEVK